MTNVPKIRFKGFTDAWEKQKLEEVISKKISNGIMNRPGRNKLNVKHINVVNLYSPSQIQPNELAYFDASNKDVEKCSIEIGDIFLTRSSLKLEGIAHANILLDDGVYVFDDHIMRLKLTSEFEPFFIKEALNHSQTKKEFMTKAKTGTMTTIGQDDITSSEITFPIKDEQNQIAKFFRTFDNTIAIYKRKLTGLRELKNAYLQLMFPQAGETVPKIRFTGFTEPWKQRKLSDMSDYKNGRGHEDRQSKSGKYELVNLNSISIDGGLKPSGKFVDDADETLLANDLVMVLSDVGHGDLLGRVAIIPSNNRFVLNQRVALLRPNQTVNPYFLFVLINAHQQYFKSQGAGMSQLNISKGAVENFQSYAPSMLEQIKIANIFKELDQQIANHTQKLRQLEQLKIAYLQKMFI